MDLGGDPAGKVCRDGEKKTGNQLCELDTALPRTRGEEARPY